LPRNKPKPGKPRLPRKVIDSGEKRDSPFNLSKGGKNSGDRGKKKGDISKHRRSGKEGGL